MKVLFLSLSSLPHLSEHSISLDLLHEFVRNKHSVYVVCSNERRNNQPTMISKEAGCHITRVRTGNLTKCNIVEKGLATLSLPIQYKIAIKKYLSKVKFDLVLYPTPPVTQYHTVKYIKRRDGAKTYLLLKDIFPQNAVDIGMLKKRGLKGSLYKYFRNIEKKLYDVSDKIGCMSKANVDYLCKHNPRVPKEKVEVCPNSIEVVDMSLSKSEKNEIRKKYKLPIDKTIFIYGGNLGKPQGIDFLVKCLESQKSNEEVFFLIIGSGTEYGKIEKYVQNKDVHNVRLVKRLEKEEYDKIVASCDVGLIFLDHRFTIPNFPSRLLSYMQAKIPVLAVTDPNTDIGKIIMEGEFGWWCESNNSHNFEQLINMACNSERISMGEKAYQFMLQNYTVESAYNIIMQMYDNIEDKMNENITN